MINSITSDIFLDNKYTTWYFRIVNIYKNKNACGYSEIHHIIPKSLGGDNTVSNLVRVSARVHFILHALLTKMCDNKTHTSKMMCAFRFMSSGHNGLRYTSKLYDRLVSNNREIWSSISKGKPQRKRTTEEKGNLSLLAKNRIRNMSSEELKIYKSRLGDSARKTHIGRKRSIETCRKISESNKGKIKIRRMHEDQFKEIREKANIKASLHKTRQKGTPENIQFCKNISAGKLQSCKKYSNEERANLSIGKLKKNWEIYNRYYHDNDINLVDNRIRELKNNELLNKKASFSKKQILKYFKSMNDMIVYFR